MLRLRNHRTRRGIAATEMALLAPIVLTLLVGIWEVGRLIMIRNILDQAAREGGRLAASGGYFSSSNHNNPLGGTFTLIAPSTNGNYEVQKKVLLYLQACGVTPTGATVKVSNTGSSSASKSWNYTWTQAGSGTGSGYDPAVAADQLDTITVTLTVPYQNVGWSPVNWFVGSGSTLSVSATWSSLRDVPVTVSTTIPSRPIQATDPLP